MEKTIRDYSIEELTHELNRRYALEAKAIYERRTAITKHIREHSEIYSALAKIMENDELAKTIDKIKNYIYNCVDITILVEDGKSFLDATTKNGSSIWKKYEEPISEIIPENKEIQYDLGL